MLEYFSSAKLLETGSHLVSQYFGTSTGIHGDIYQYKCHLPTPFVLIHPNTTTLSPHFTLGLALELCIHCGSPGQVHAKHVGPHLSLTNLSRSHLAKECASEYWSFFGLCQRASKGLLLGHRPERLTSCNALHTVWAVTETLTSIDNPCAKSE